LKFFELASSEAFGFDCRLLETSEAYFDVDAEEAGPIEEFLYEIKWKHCRLDDDI